ncbi:MAG: hypothetical protein JWP10_584 [Nocardioidaceae bacterium]|nr:hypothetical protein [Nocardioidaceae bacterium]
MMTTKKTKSAIAGGALLLACVGGGAAMVLSGPASATDGARSYGETHAPPSGTKNVDPSKSQRSDETLLTGTKLAKVTAAVKAKYPTAEIQRVETDSDGVYEAHVVTKGGKHVIVQVGADFAVTGTQTGGPGGKGGPEGRRGGPGGKGDKTPPAQSE